MLQSYTIALMCGGNSNEREVSFSSAANVEQALASAGHKVVKVDTANKGFLEELKQLNPDVAFIALHGKGGEDGSLQAVFEHMGIPYTGSGVLGSALAMDKYRSKIIYEALGLKTPRSLRLKRSQRGTHAASHEYVLKIMGLPVVIKPSEEGSSFGITIAKDAKTLQRAVEESFDSGTEVLLAERYVQGVEITISVLGSTELQALPAIEIIPKNEFYDFESKYTEGGCDHIIPARISEKVLAEANRAALVAHEGLGCFGVSRTDMIVDDEDTVWVIETNTVPGMTGTSLLPHAAEYNGISNEELYESFIIWALERAARASL
ncbi:MAG: D-alanine--D-alanine ligase [Coriobacteriia bacterium]|nr:D-alanine--D-alanine ligase [Coriobacteriia bacterium]MCL2749698.1 D-alanine--D-alanine ligase [Coriobacteriia bacterium]